MISLIVNIILTYFTFRFVLWLFNLNKDNTEDQQSMLIENSQQKIDLEPLILPPDPKINLSLDNINSSNDTNIKNILLEKETKIKRKHITVRVNYT